jgi:hypothetical protein
MAWTPLYQIRLASGLNIVAGLWLIISPYGFGFHLLNPPFWNSVVVGCLVAVFATLRLVFPFRFPEISWINVLLGGYLVISPFLFGFADIAAALWNCVGVGIFFILMAAWSAAAGARGSRVLD